MAEGLEGWDYQDAARFPANHKNLAEEREKILDESFKRNEDLEDFERNAKFDSREDYAKSKELEAGVREMRRAENINDAFSKRNLWESSQHVKEKLPEYIETAKQEAERPREEGGIGEPINPMTPEEAFEIQQRDRQAEQGEAPQQ